MNHPKCKCGRILVICEVEKGKCYECQYIEASRARQHAAEFVEKYYIGDTISPVGE